jgi:acyl carrier protein
MDVMEKFTTVFRETFSDNTIQLTKNTTADDIEGWDSLSHVNLILAIELAFDIEFTLGEIMTFKKVGDMAACVEGKLSH